MVEGRGNLNKKHLKNVGPIRHCEPPHAHSSGVASGTVARRLCIDVHDNDNAWQRGPLWPHGMGPTTASRAMLANARPSSLICIGVKNWSVCLYSYRVGASLAATQCQYMTLRIWEDACTRQVALQWNWYRTFLIDRPLYIRCIAFTSFHYIMLYSLLDRTAGTPCVDAAGYCRCGVVCDASVGRRVLGTRVSCGKTAEPIAWGCLVDFGYVLPSQSRGEYTDMVRGGRGKGV